MTQNMQWMEEARQRLRARRISVDFRGFPPEDLDRLGRQIAAALPTFLRESTGEAK